MTPEPTGDLENQSAPKKAPGSSIGFLIWCYLIVAVLIGAFVFRAAPATPRAWIFAICVTLSYGLIYTLPTLIVILLTRWFRRKGAALRFIADGLVVIVASLSHLLLASDYAIQGMFGFHINGFVINLITTPEGLDSMGADQGTKVVYLLMAVGTVVANAVAWYVLVGLQAGRKIGLNLAGRRLKWVIGVLLLLTAAERITYGVSYIQARPDVMAISAAVPGYQPTSFRSLAKKFGVEMHRRVSLDAPKSNATLVYPKNPLVKSTPEKPPNLIYFVCESLRADMLTPEIMPRLWAFAQENQRFTNHYSGGNGTRMAVFTTFYGIPGNYWFKFLNDRRPPVFMDRVQELNYHLHFSTSASFSYPEFDKTIFSHVPASALSENGEGEGWQRDRQNVGWMKEWLKKEDGSAPFFLFHFFESPHARYYFPPECVIRKPYLEAFNYATVDVKRDIELIRNRYINAVNHLDSQLGEMIDALREKGVLDNSVIIITGDHGEEFMECGRWGHNSEFSEPQLKVPLVVHMPGRAPAVYDYATSHLDFVPTVMPLLGVTNPPSDYTTGENLFSSKHRLLTFADWDRIAISDGVNKAIFPINTGGQMNTRVTTAKDQPVKDENAVLRQMGGPMVKLKDMMSQFTMKH